MSYRLQRLHKNTSKRFRSQAPNRLSVSNRHASPVAPPIQAFPADQPAPEGLDDRPLASSSYSTDHLEAFAERYSALSDRRSSANPWGIVIVVLISLVWVAGLAIGFQTALAIQLGLGIFLAILGLLSPSLGLLSIGLLSTLDAMAAEYLLTGGLLRFNTVNYWLLLVIALYLPFILRLRDSVSRTLQVFLLLLALEISFSSDIPEGLQDVLNIGATFGIVVYFARSLNDELALYWLGIVTGLMAALTGFVYFLQIDTLPYANPNNWTYMQITALFAICISFPYARAFKKNKLILIFLAIVNFAWVFLSGSRGGILLASLCVLYLFLTTRSFTWRTVMIALAMILGIWVSTQFAEQNLYSIGRLQLLFDETVNESRRTSKRSDIAQAGIALFKENPLGIGTGSFRREAQDTGYITGDKPAHSGWIKTLAENGIPGIVLLVAFVLSFAVTGFHKHRDGKLQFGLFISFVFAAAFISKEFQGKSLWFLAAAGIVLLNPETIKAHLERKLKPNDIDYRQRLREVRFGRR